MEKVTPNTSKAAPEQPPAPKDAATHQGAQQHKEGPATVAQPTPEAHQKRPRNKLPKHFSVAF
jgi:hypothetical protein